MVAYSIVSLGYHNNGNTDDGRSSLSRKSQLVCIECKKMCVAAAVMLILTQNTSLKPAARAFTGGLLFIARFFIEGGLVCVRIMYIMKET